MHPPDPRLDSVWHALGTVIDPEIGLDVVTLGLIYAVEIRDDVAWTNELHGMRALEEQFVVLATIAPRPGPVR